MRVLAWKLTNQRAELKEERDGISKFVRRQTSADEGSW